jgi:cytochrome c2
MRASLAAALVCASPFALVACASAHASRSAPAGEAAYRAHCAACHRLYDPAARTAAEWGRQLDRMAARAHLAGEDRAAVLAYLRAHAKDAPPEGR